mmetsp:Transcript_1179/g.4001  ORF Transcript_1179/g.4001 Transcript_1179/m.4001 type:complete len:658 (-) Transcript_1179:155-2128(-)
MDWFGIESMQNSTLSKFIRNTAGHEVLTEEEDTKMAQNSKLNEADGAIIPSEVTAMSLQERLWWAARRGSLQLLRALEAELDELNIEQAEPSTGWCALHLAAGEAGSVSATVLLLDVFGANPNARTSEFLGLKAPLHLAASRGHYQCCDVLIQRNARTDARTADGRTALHIAAESGSAETVQLLLRFATSIDRRDDNGQSPLHLACVDGAVDCVDVLLKNGADREARDAAGRCPFDALLISRRGDVSRIAELLGHRLPESICDRIELIIDHYEHSERACADEKPAHADEKPVNEDKEMWIVVKEGKMVETMDQRVALFRTALSAARWTSRFASKSNARPARVVDWRSLVATAPTDHVADEEGRDTRDDLLAAFAGRAREEQATGVQVLTAKTLENVRKVETELAELRLREGCALEEVGALEQNAFGVVAECQLLQATICDLRTIVHAERRGQDLLNSATRLAQIGHPAAATSADPGRLSKAAVFFLKQNEARAPSNAHASAAQTRISDRIFPEADGHCRADSLAAIVATAPVQSVSVVAAEDVSEAATNQAIQAAAAPSLIFATPASVPESEVDNADIEITMLRELQAELKAAGVRRYATVAGELHKQELSWSQLERLYLRGGSESLHCILSRVGLTIGAIAAINHRLSTAVEWDEP